MNTNELMGENGIKRKCAYWHVPVEGGLLFRLLCFPGLRHFQIDGPRFGTLSQIMVQ